METLGQFSVEINTKGTKVKRFNESIDHPYRIVFVDVIFEPIRQQQPLCPINAIDESFHAQHPSSGAEILPVALGFSHSLGQERTFATVA